MRWPKPRRSPAACASRAKLGNLPPNICNPAWLAAQAQVFAEGRDGVACEVLEREAMQALGMGALLGVAQGSANAPKLIVLRWNGGGDGARPYALVGKGITFDTGGISIKPGAGMEEMKFDMCGAAGVLGAFVAAVELKLPLNLVCIVAAVENMPDGSAYRPSDVLTSMSGTTIEVLNTDAEGRLILCDALTYAQRFEPQVIIDAATLTGACVVALGKHASGLMSADDELAAQLIAAGEASLDRAAPAAVGRLPGATRFRLRRRRQHRRQVCGRDHRRLLPVAVHHRLPLGPPRRRRHRLGRGPQGSRHRSSGAAARAVPDRPLRMNATVDPLQRRKLRAIISVYGISLVCGAWIAMLFPGLTNPDTLQATMDALRGHWVNWLYQIAALVACFTWLEADSRQLDIRRPWWLNLGVILATSVFVPYYLYKTRPAGRRLQPILIYFGILFSSAFAMVVGLMIGLILSSPAPATPASAI